MFQPWRRPRTLRDINDVSCYCRHLWHWRKQPSLDVGFVPGGRGLFVVHALSWVATVMLTLLALATFGIGSVGVRVPRLVGLRGGRGGGGDLLLKTSGTPVPASPFGLKDAGLNQNDPRKTAKQLLQICRFFTTNQTWPNTLLPNDSTLKVSGGFCSWRSEGPNDLVSTVKREVGYSRTFIQKKRLTLERCLRVWSWNDLKPACDNGGALFWKGFLIARCPPEGASVLLSNTTCS